MACLQGFAAAGGGWLSTSADVGAHARRDQWPECTSRIGSEAAAVAPAQSGIAKIVRKSRRRESRHADASTCSVPDCDVVAPEPAARDVTSGGAPCKKTAKRAETTHATRVSSARILLAKSSSSRRISTTSGDLRPARPMSANSHRLFPTAPISKSRVLNCVLGLPGSQHGESSCEQCFIVPR